MARGGREGTQEEFDPRARRGDAHAARGDWPRADAFLAWRVVPKSRRDSAKSRSPRRMNRRTRRRTRAVFHAWRAYAVSVVRAFVILRSLARVERARRGFLDASDSFRGWRRGGHRRRLPRGSPRRRRRGRRDASRGTRRREGSGASCACGTRSRARASRTRSGAGRTTSPSPRIGKHRASSLRLERSPRSASPSSSEPSRPLQPTRRA